MRKSYKHAGIAGAAASLLLGAAMLVPSTGNAADTLPSEDACHATNNSMPAGNCGDFTQLVGLNFNAVQVPLGGFSNCAGNGDFKCAGLKTKYPSYYTTLGAYPSGWPDTANPANHSNGNTRKMGGEYRPQDTMSVVKDSAGDGQLKIHMWHEGNGTATSPAGLNHVAAPIPLPCMNLRYGKFTERTQVSGIVNGFKIAHLRYSDNDNEVDYPEAGGNFKSDPISEFTHTFTESGADVAPNSAWTSWHTFSTEIIPGKLSFYLDGKLVKTVNGDFPDFTDWVLQNESSLGGGYAAKGTSVDINTSWLACYRYNGTTPAKKSRR